jgi:hypothetical protein
VAAVDLDAASAQFRQLGFRVKQGRLHPNNLLNRHIKFRDGSGVELMTVQGKPGDATARRYTTLTADGGGGVYVALDAMSTGEPDSVAATLRLEPQRSTSGPWQFVSFPDSSPAAAVFFAVGVPMVLDPDSLVSHDPEVSGLAEAWLEGGSELIALLEGLGAKRCGAVSSPDGQMGERLGLRRGQVVIVPAQPNARPRVLGVVLSLRLPGEAVVWPQRRFWIRYLFNPSQLDV